MKKFEFTIGNGTMFPYVFEIEAEEYECTQDAFDKLVDKLEAEENEGLFISPDEIDNYYEDQYAIGGNHGRYVFHDGVFNFREVT